MVQTNLENGYYFKLCLSLKNCHLSKEIDFYYFSDLLIDLKNGICQFSQLWVFESLDLFVMREMNN